MILITGANGHFGSAAIDFLLEKGVSANNIVGLVRSTEKAADLQKLGIAIRLGDYTDYNSLRAALKGVDQLLFVSTSSVHRRLEEHANVVKAAIENGVRRVVYTSFIRKNETASSPLAGFMEAHIATEKAIKASGMNYTIMRNNHYADFIPWIIGDRVLETGIYYPASDTKVNWTFRSDMAEAAANILTGQGHDYTDYNISSNEQVSFPQIASFLSGVSGKQVSYTSPDIKDYIAKVKNDGLPEDLVGVFSGFGLATAQGEFLTENPDLERILGRKPMQIWDFLRMIYSPL